MKEMVVIMDAREEGREEGREEERINTYRERQRADAAEAELEKYRVYALEHGYKEPQLL